MNPTPEALCGFGRRPWGKPTLKTKGSIVQFILANWMLILVALASGGMLLWPAMAGGAGLGAVTPAMAVQAMNREKAVVIDVRSEAEFAAEHVQGAKHIALADLGTRLAAEVKNKATPVIFVCAKGNASRRATLVAKQQGFEQAQSLAGGYKAWVDAGLPIAKAANVTKAA